jgi:hypothetical protein
MNYLRWDRGLESHTRHGCLWELNLCLCCTMCRQQPHDGLIPCIRSPTVCVHIKKLKKKSSQGPQGLCSHRQTDKLWNPSCIPEYIFRLTGTDNLQYTLLLIIHTWNSNLWIHLGTFILIFITFWIYWRLNSWTFPYMSTSEPSFHFSPDLPSVNLWFVFWYPPHSMPCYCRMWRTREGSKDQTLLLSH